jgi:hypothetical protein
VGIGAIARAPVEVSHQIMGFAHNLFQKKEKQELLEPIGMPTAAIVRAMEAVCENLSIAPGKVCFAHSHVPLEAYTSSTGEWTFWNPGAWLWDKRIRNHPDYRNNAWPGTLLRATGDELELRGLLNDWGADDFQKALGQIPQPARRRRGKLSTIASQRSLALIQKIPLLRFFEYFRQSGRLYSRP